MDIFLDSSNINELRRWLDYGVIDGVTTNPSILLKDGADDLEQRSREIANLIFPLPLSVEVYTNDQEEMLRQGRSFFEWGSNIVVKIPVINENGEPCLGVVKTLVDEGIKVNMTACLSFGQVALGAKAGATYCSIFGGRVADEGHDVSLLIKQIVDWLNRWDYQTKLIVGSIRGAIDIQNAALSGAHVVTVPPQFLDKWIDHQYTRETVRQFNQDAARTLTESRSRVIR